MPVGRVHVARGVRRSSLDDLVLALPRPLDQRVGGWRRVVGLGRRRGARRAGRGGAADTWHGYQVEGRGLGEAPELQGVGARSQGGVLAWRCVARWILRIVGNGGKWANLLFVTGPAGHQTSRRLNDFCYQP